MNLNSAGLGGFDEVAFRQLLPLSLQQNYSQLPLQDVKPITSGLGSGSGSGSGSGQASSSNSAGAANGAGAGGGASGNASAGPSQAKKRKTTKPSRKSPDSNGNGNGNGNAEGGEGGATAEDKGESKKRPQSCDVCRARKVKCVKPPGAPRCEGCVSLDQKCEYTHERKKPGPANSFARKASPPRPTEMNPSLPGPNPQQLGQHSLSQPQVPLQMPMFPTHVRSYSHGATPTFDMPPPRWTPPILQSQPPLPMTTSAPGPSSSASASAAAAMNNIFLPSASSPFGFPSATAQIAASAGFNLDAGFLPISPQSLLHPQPGEVDSASEGSPMGRWSWMSGFEDLWDTRPDGWIDQGVGTSAGMANMGSGSGAGMSNQLLPLFDGLTPQDPPTGPSTAGSAGSGILSNNSASAPTNTTSQQAQAVVSNTIANAASGGPGLQHDASSIPRPTSAPERDKTVRFGQNTVQSVPRHSMDLGMGFGKARLEDVAPLSTITRILHGYYAHLYALMPVVHWPTFSQQLVAREDERSDAWRAFVLSLVAYSIIQLPRSVLSFLPVRDLRKLHQRCHAESRKLQNRSYREIRLIDISTLYCDHIYLGTLGRTHFANILLAEAIRLAQTMNLHDERIGEPVANVIEQETRRRVFWLLYGSDRTITALTSVPMHIQDCDLCIPLPMAIDDALLTAAGAFPQAAHTTPLLAGFHFNCRLYRLLGAVQTAHRNLISSSSNPLTDPFPVLQLPQLPVPLRPSKDFMDALDRMIADLPGPLQLIGPMSPPTTAVAGGYAAADAKDSGFATCRANLLISQAMVRFAIRQYARAAGEMEAEGKNWAETDVLQLLESMSSESLAANGESLRRKVLFVASSLLEKYPSSAEGHSYVADFLAVYTRISEEQHAALLEESAAPSRETSPVRSTSGTGAAQGGGRVQPSAGSGAGGGTAGSGPGPGSGEAQQLGQPRSV